MSLVGDRPGGAAVTATLASTVPNGVGVVVTVVGRAPVRRGGMVGGARARRKRDSERNTGRGANDEMGSCLFFALSGLFPQDARARSRTPLLTPPSMPADAPAPSGQVSTHGADRVQREAWPAGDAHTQKKTAARPHAPRTSARPSSCRHVHHQPPWESRARWGPTGVV